MLSQEQYDSYYEIIMNNIAKLRQTYKHLNEVLSYESIHFLIDLISTWEFDTKWIRDNMSIKIKDNDNKEEIRNEFYNTLISNIRISKEKLKGNNICGFYSLNTTINYKISKDITIQKLEGRKIVIDDNKEEEKVILTFLFIYHMMIVEELIEDQGITISLEQLKEEFNDNLDIINLCKKCTKNTLISDIKTIDNLEEYSKERNIPMWFIDNTKKYEEKHCIS